MPVNPCDARGSALERERPSLGKAARATVSRFVCCGLFVLLMLPASAQASPIKGDEDLQFFTTAARKDGDAWVVPVHAWVFEHENAAPVRAALLSALATSIGLGDKAVKSAIFRDRARWFIVDNQSGKEVRTSLADADLDSTGRNGHTQSELRMEGLQGTEATFYALLQETDPRVFGSPALLVPPEGLSVISDIDDTIKISEVLDRQKLLENTFLKTYQPAPGMVEAYERLAQAGAAFHYVSSSPWQLYPALTAFMDDHGFPSGSVDLRLFRVWDDSLMNLMKSSEQTKPPVISRLLADFPQRTFIMIGDSGEKDPEIYGRIARENPGRVRHIYVRDVTGDKPDGPRYRKAFKDLAPSAWTVFSDASIIKP